MTLITKREYNGETLYTVTHGKNVCVVDERTYKDLKIVEFRRRVENLNTRWNNIA